MSYAAPGSLLHTEQCSAPMDPSLSKTHGGGTTNAHCSTCEKRQTKRKRIYLVPTQHLPQKPLICIIHIYVCPRKYFIPKAPLYSQSTELTVATLHRVFKHLRVFLGRNCVGEAFVCFIQCRNTIHAIQPCYCTAST